MARLVLILLALFAAPTLAWFAWRWWQRKRAGAQTELAPAERWQDAPWMWLVLVGLVLSVATVFAFGIWEQRDCQPVPSQVIDGKFVPAHCD